MEQEQPNIQHGGQQGDLQGSQQGSQSRGQQGDSQDARVRALKLEVTKLKRALEKERNLSLRTRANFEAKAQLSDIVMAERSRLERNMSLTLHHSTNMLLFFDTKGVIDFCADLFLAFRGLAGFGLIKGQTLRELTSAFLPEDFIACVEQLLDTSAEAVAAGQADLARNTQFQAFSHIEGELRDYLVRAVLLIGDHNVKDGLLIQLYDITEFSRAQHAAEQANVAKSDFLATVSHEIRTPMNAIIGLADMLATTELSERQSEYLTKIQTSSISMLGLINDILDFSKIEAGKLDLLNEYFRLPDLLKNLESLFEVMMMQKALTFSCHFAADLPQVVFSDDKRVRQILTNILNNAYKYTPAGGVSLSVSVANGVDATGATGGATGATGANDSDGPNSDEPSTWVQFDISDTGIGIKEEDLGKLFMEFEQLDVVRNKNVTGTGLGLAITQRLVEMMQGRIEVKSVYGQGSTFTVLLPFKMGAESDLPAALDDVVVFTAPEARILIVDDVEVNIEIAEFMLEPYGVQIEKAYDGLEAVQLADTQHFDLILMDQMMPTMDGMEATRHIRELEGAASKVPIVALTANAIQGMEAKFIEAGFNGFISKPIDMRKLAQVLYEVLPKHLIHS